MKPTLEQLQEWRSQALEYAHAITNQYPSWKDAVDLKFAELAAAWGASQAQQEPCADYRAMYLKVRDELAALQQVAEVKQLRQDAKRYRFIRDNIYRLPYDDHGAGPEFDLSEEAIDSAMKGGQHE